MIRAFTPIAAFAVRPILPRTSSTLEMAPLRVGFAARAATVVVALLACAGLASAVQREYYWNEVTNVSQWEIPDVAVAYEDKATGKKYYVDPDSGESVWTYPGDWKEYESEEHDGQMYYHNEKTDETTWDKPEELGWKRVQVDEDEL